MSSVPQVHAANRSAARTVLVHQMGKVGSRSLVSALEKLPGLEIVHTHQLNLEGLARLREQHKAKRLRVPPHVGDAERIHREFLARGRKLELITVVREPIGRNFSAFFQNLEFFATADPRDPSVPVERYIQEFLEGYAHHVPLRWFDLQVKEPLGLDVFEHPFPHDVGYQIFEHDGHRMLLLRAESSDAVKLRGVNEFLGANLTALPRVNVGDNKDYSEIYQAFKERIRLSEAYVDELLDSKYTRHFYTSEEIAGFRRKWLPEPAPAAEPGPQLTIPVGEEPVVVEDIDKPSDWEPAAVLVHQMGKVGSQTIFQSLERLGRWPVYQTHVLGGIEKHVQNGRVVAPQGRSSVPPHLERSREAIERHLAKSQPVAVITLVREPVSRNVSAFFQNLWRVGSPRLTDLVRTVRWCRKTFLKRYDHTEPLRWFDKQMKAPFGVDVYAFPFPRRRGWLVLRKGERRFLILRVELPDNRKRRLVARFLGLEKLRLVDRNVGETKDYGPLYRRFRQRPRLPRSYLERMLTSRYAQHFYTPDERQKAMEKWSR